MKASKLCWGAAALAGCLAYLVLGGSLAAELPLQGAGTSPGEMSTSAEMSTEVLVAELEVTTTLLNTVVADLVEEKTQLGDFEERFVPEAEIEDLALPADSHVIREPRPGGQLVTTFHLPRGFDLNLDDLADRALTLRQELDKRLNDSIPD